MNEYVNRLVHSSFEWQTLKKPNAVAVDAIANFSA